LTQPKGVADAAVSIHESERFEDAVAYQIHRTNRLLLTHLSRFLEMSVHNMTPEKWLLLARIYQRGSVRQVDLTEPALEDAPNVSRLVDGLAKAGFVDRIADPADRRGRLLSCTEQGERLCGKLMERSVPERVRVFDGFSEADLETFGGFLDRVEANVRPLLIAGSSHESASA
jgi:MarR family transcriptional regulator for hemolysin